MVLIHLSGALERERPWWRADGLIHPRLGGGAEMWHLHNRCEPGTVNCHRAHEEHVCAEIYVSL